MHCVTITQLFSTVVEKNLLLLDLKNMLTINETTLVSTLKRGFQNSAPKRGIPAVLSIYFSAMPFLRQCPFDGTLTIVARTDKDPRGQNVSL